MNVEDKASETNAARDDGTRKPWHPPVIEVTDTRSAESGFATNPDGSASS